MAFGDPDRGPVVVCFDRAANASMIPAFVTSTDLLRVVVSGSVLIAGEELPRLGFRLQQAATMHGASRPGSKGSHELWLFADRPGVPTLGVEIDKQLDPVALRLRWAMSEHNS